MDTTTPAVTEEKRLSWNRKVIGAYQDALTPLGKIASSLLGLWVIASVLGWKRADSYYTALGADWITSKLTVIDFLSLSYWPVVALALGILVTLTDLADRYEKGMKNVWRITYGLMVIAFCLAWWFSWHKDFETSTQFYLTLLLSVALVQGILLGLLVLELAENNFKWYSKDIWLLFSMTVFYVSVVSFLGTSEGKRDRNIEQTKLSILETRGGERLHLLLERGGVLYAASLRDGGYPRVKIVESKDTLSIYKADHALINTSAKEPKRPEPAQSKGSPIRN